MKCKITIINRREVERNEALGMECDPAVEITDFWVKDDCIESFWIDEVDMEIVFSVGGDDYRTPYSDKLFKEFITIIENK